MTDINSFCLVPPSKPDSKNVKFWLGKVKAVDEESKAVTLHWYAQKPDDPSWFLKTDLEFTARDKNILVSIDPDQLSISPTQKEFIQFQISRSQSASMLLAANKKSKFVASGPSAQHRDQVKNMFKVLKAAQDLQIQTSSPSAAGKRKKDQDLNASKRKKKQRNSLIASSHNNLHNQSHHKESHPKVGLKHQVDPKVINSLLQVSARDPDRVEAKEDVIKMREHKNLESGNVTIKLWSSAEKELFEKALYQHGEHFDKVAKCLKNKSRSDCVQYFYDVFQCSRAFSAWHKQDIEKQILLERSKVASSSSSAVSEEQSKNNVDLVSDEDDNAGKNIDLTTKEKDHQSLTAAQKMEEIRKLITQQPQQMQVQVQKPPQQQQQPPQPQLMTAQEEDQLAAISRYLVHSQQHQQQLQQSQQQQSNNNQLKQLQVLQAIQARQQLLMQASQQQNGIQNLVQFQQQQQQQQQPSSMQFSPEHLLLLQQQQQQEHNHQQQQAQNQQNSLSALQELQNNARRLAHQREVRQSDATQSFRVEKMKLKVTHQQEAVVLQMRQLQELRSGDLNDEERMMLLKKHDGEKRNLTQIQNERLLSLQVEFQQQPPLLTQDPQRPSSASSSSIEHPSANVEQTPQMSFEQLRQNLSASQKSSAIAQNPSISVQQQQQLRNLQRLQQQQQQQPQQQTQTFSPAYLNHLNQMQQAYNAQQKQLQAIVQSQNILRQLQQQQQQQQQQQTPQQQQLNSLLMSQQQQQQQMMMQPQPQQQHSQPQHQMPMIPQADSQQMRAINQWLSQQQQHQQQQNQSQGLLAQQFLAQRNLQMQQESRQHDAQNNGNNSNNNNNMSYQDSKDSQQ